MDSKIRPRILPEPAVDDAVAAGRAADVDDKPRRKGFRYRPWAEHPFGCQRNAVLLKRTFQIDIRCPRCQGSMNAKDARERKLPISYPWRSLASWRLKYQSCDASGSGWAEPPSGEQVSLRS